MKFIIYTLIAVSIMMSGVLSLPIMYVLEIPSIFGIISVSAVIFGVAMILISMALPLSFFEEKTAQHNLRSGSN